jgi:hypothetical protein
MMRIAKTIGLIIGIYAIALVAEVAMYSSSPEYQGGITLFIALGAIAFLAPKVGYRWFDCLFLIIPIYGVIFLFRISYRVAYLPNRDWSERAAS